MNSLDKHHGDPEAASDHEPSSSSSGTTAWTASFLFHGLLVLLLGMGSFAMAPEKFFAMTYDVPEIPLDEEVLVQKFFSEEQAPADIGALSQAGSDSAAAAALELNEYSQVSFEQRPLSDYGDLTITQVDDPVVQGPNFSKDLQVQGVGNVGTTGATGAIDRITHEIITSLEQEKTLVVWLFDQSGSLREERERILGRMRRIYDELGVIEAAENPAFKRLVDKPLLTAVVGFGASPKLLTPRPTDRLDEIKAAIQAIEDDDSGRENVFGAVASTVEKFRRYRTTKNGNRNVMLVVFTDESGDDIDRLDATINLCRKQAIPVYVIGRPAPFGRRVAHVKWIDPDPNFDQRPQWVPVNLGPETVMPERLKLLFFGSAGKDEPLDSGYGPYALTRLCYETGGLYFAAHPNRSVGRRVSRRETNSLASHFSTFYQTEVMRRYQPEYVAVEEYMKRLRKSPARQALVEAAQLSWTSSLENVRLRFPKRDEASLATSLSTAQRSAAVLQPRINRICELLLAGEPQREELRSPRWKAGFDLALGRALATKVRCDSYNAALAQAKQGMQFEKEKNNTWVLVASETFTSSGLERMAKKSRQLLEQVQEEHAETPWATLAQRELRQPLGWSWNESFTMIEPRKQGGGGNAPPRPPRERPKPPPRRNPPPL